MKHKINLDLYRYIAHRGFHNEERPENSMAAFKAAKEAGLPIELDIHLTKDGQLVVFHDSLLKRMTGVEGVLEDFTVEELNATYHLPDGSNLPLFKDVLDLIHEEVPIVVELKPYNKNWKKLAEATLNALKDIQNKEMITIISFDPRCLFPVKKGPFAVGLLLADERKDVLLFRHFFDYLDVEQVLLTNKKVMAFRKKEGPINTWTIRNEEQYNAAKPYADMLTMEHMNLSFYKEGR